MICTFVAKAQQRYPVHWTINNKKLSANTYELHFMAIIDQPWHIYAQDNNEDYAMPTAFSFVPNADYELSGKPKEVGKLQQETISGINVKYYQDTVDFVQVVTLKKGTAKISGKIAYMACTERCLPEAEREFHLVIGDDN